MKVLKELKWMTIVYGVILFSIGIVEFVLSIVNFGAALNTISYLVAAGLLIVGIMHIAASLIKDTQTFFKSTLVSGAICLAAGVVFIIQPNILGSFFVYLIASLALVFALIFIIKTIIAIKFKYKGSWIFAYIFAAIILIVLGVLAFVYLNKSMTVVQVIFCVMSAVVATIGVVTFIYGIKAVSKKEEPKE